MSKIQQKLIELIPNRQLLNSNFDGYKLSLQELPRKTREFTTGVDRVLLNSHQYSILHANLYGFHNHLLADPYDETNSVYFIDINLNICKVYVDPFNDELIEPITVLQLPRSRERQTGDYNVSLRFVSPSLAVIGDGTGTLYIVNTGSRNDDDTFSISFVDEVAGQDEPFVILDAVLKTNKDDNEQLDILALSLKQEKNERFFTILHWISFSKVQDVWGQIAIKQIKTKGCVQYSYLEKNCESVYVISDKECKFILNSDFPVVEDVSSNVKKVYKWSQTIEDVTIKISLSEETNKQDIKVYTENTKIEVKCVDNILVHGELNQKVDSDITTWIFEQGILEITLCKEETGLMWSELIKNDSTGEYVVETCIVEEAHAQLGHRTNDTETIPPSGTTFNSQQVEECDFENDKTFSFERLCGKTNSTTHKVNLGSHQVLITANLKHELVPAIGIRHDVDICLWQPKETDNFSITHEGTLLALGYVQASKQNRKFTVCPPNMECAVICESSGHLFIYRQNKPITNTELRNRNTGRRIQNIAQQQVVHFSNEEVLGIHVSNTNLFLLCEKSITVLNL